MKECGACNQIKPCKRISSWSDFFISNLIIGLPPMRHLYLCELCFEYEKYIEVKEKKERKKVREKREEEYKKRIEEYIKKRDKVLRKIKKLKNE